VEAQCPELATEATVITALAKGFLFQQTEQSLRELTTLVEIDPENPLLLFLASLVAVKNSTSEIALALLTQLNGTASGIPLTYSYYVAGEVHLQRGDYGQAIAHYQMFVRKYAGENYIKDAQYKTAICYWLQGNRSKALDYQGRAKNSGREAAEADRYAVQSLQDPFPVPQLAKLRYATDGGYYIRAEELILSTRPDDLPMAKDRVEFDYRKARLYHKTNRIAEAKTNYLVTIDHSEDEHWYFAPNACLQLGYIAEAEGRLKEAEMYYELALGYKRHAYKNSIDSKARSALHQLKKKQIKPVK
jgi:tetratricopeptide (TPR) repeat protein